MKCSRCEKEYDENLTGDFNAICPECRGWKGYPQDYGVCKCGRKTRIARTIGPLGRTYGRNVCAKCGRVPWNCSCLKVVSR